MALYKDLTHLAPSTDPAFDILHPPGGEVGNPYFSGIYRCEGCGREIAHNVGDPFPPENHEHHKPEQGKIRWRLIVRSEG